MGWKTASVSLTAPELPRAYREACRSPLGFPMGQMEHGEIKAVHKLLQAAYTSVSHRAHIFTSKEDVLDILDLDWPRANPLEQSELGISFANTVQEAWTAASSLVQGGWHAAYFGKNFNVFKVMFKQSWKTLLSTSLTLKSTRSVQSVWPL